MKRFILLTLLLIHPVLSAWEATLPPRIFTTIEVKCVEPKRYEERWKQFIAQNLKYAKEVERLYGINATFVLAQSALETGFGKSTPGNMFFAIKDFDGVNGDEQLLKTTDYFRTPTKNLKHIISITEVSPGLFKYRHRDYFKKYTTPMESFNHYGKYLHKKLKGIPCDDPRQLSKAMKKIGYATDTAYEKKLNITISKIETFINQQLLWDLTSDLQAGSGTYLLRSASSE